MDFLVIIGLLIFLVAAFGVVTNGTVVYVIWRTKQLNHPFLILTAGLTFVDALFTVIYLTYVAPATMLCVAILDDFNVSSVFGFAMMVCYFAAMTAHFIIAVNRFLAVFAPMFYNSVFNVRFTKKIVVMNFLFSLLFNSFFHVLFNCRCFYNTALHTFTYTSTPNCKLYAHLSGVHFCFFLHLGNAILDSLTWWKLNEIMKAQRDSSSSWKTAKRDISYVKQAFAQTVYLLVHMLLFVFGYDSIVRDPKIGVIITSLGFSSFFASDGLITIILNKEVRARMLKKTFVKPRASFQV